MRRIAVIGLFIFMLVFAFAGTALAGSNTKGASGITLSYPDDMVACQPSFPISTTGIPGTFSARYNIFEVKDSSLVQIGSGNVNGNLNINFTPQALEPGTTKTYAVFIAVFNADGVLKLKLSGKWNVTCEEAPPPPPPQGGEGCTPGYWRQEHHFDSWVPTGYTPQDSYNAVFGVNGAYATLLNAVWATGGREGALARHAVAALLNASHPDVSYEYTVAEVLAGVQAAYASGDFEPSKDALDAANNAGYPLD